MFVLCCPRGCSTRPLLDYLMLGFSMRHVFQFVRYLFFHASIFELINALVVHASVFPFVCSCVSHGGFPRVLFSMCWGCCFETCYLGIRTFSLSTHWFRFLGLEQRLVACVETTDTDTQTDRHTYMNTGAVPRHCRGGAEAL